MESHSLIQITLFVHFLRHIVIFSFFCLTGLLRFYLLILQWMKLLIDSICHQRHYTNTELLYLIELVMWTFLVNDYCYSKWHSATKTVFVLYCVYTDLFITALGWVRLPSSSSCVTLLRKKAKCVRKHVGHSMWHPVYSNRWRSQQPEASCHDAVCMRKCALDRDRKGQFLNFHTQMCMCTLVYTCKKITGIDGHKSMHTYTLTPNNLYAWSLHPFILTGLLSSHEKAKCKCPPRCIQDWLQSSHTVVKGAYKIYALWVIPVAQMVEQYQCHGFSPKRNVRNYIKMYTLEANLHVCIWYAEK